ncbi:hypothetical protein EYC84_004138 [Monilinia fructicola]|uniref:Uncharacterized protein n=1 Tax=Monilinia fructicola TaxID=38448 RepID=A0A5M9K1V4_MONFR|nr:hypothetical protein EYC84_004138 [Monilinia fructicola]
MPQKESVSTAKAPPPLPFFSQAVKCQGMVYCSGSIGMDVATKKLVEGGIADRTRQSLLNLQAILEAAGSSIDNSGLAFAVHELPLGTDVEIECTAHLGEVSLSSSLPSRANLMTKDL